MEKKTIGQFFKFSTHTQIYSVFQEIIRTFSKCIVFNMKIASLWCTVEI